MKLSEIDILTRTKNTYSNTLSELRMMRANGCAGIQFYNMSTITDEDITGKVRDVVIEMKEVSLRELKTKLMMLGVTDFEE